jgi:ribosomal protein S18 acetylase RimI-like enzyme
VKGDRLPAFDKGLDMVENIASTCSVRRLAPADRPAWRQLYDGYAAFYSVSMNDEIAGRLWDWLMDAAHPLAGYVALDGRGEVVGLAHVRPYPRSLSANWAGFLDDLYVDPAHRRCGVGHALLAAVAAHAREAGWSFVRWMTADDNHTAQHLYERVAKRTRWVTYQLDPAVFAPIIEKERK